MNKLKQIIKGLSVVIIYLVLSELIVLPLLMLGIDYQNLPQYIKIIYILVYELLMLSLIINMFKKELITGWKDLKKNHKDYFNKYFKYWILAVGLMSISNIIISFFVEGQASNQEAIVKMFESSPFYIFITAVVIAPLLEELVFRLAFKNIFGENWLFVLASGLAFGLIHVIGSGNFMAELVYIIPYSIPGFIFAYVLLNSKNIFVPVGLHLIHNGFLIALQFLAMFLR